MVIRANESIQRQAENVRGGDGVLRFGDFIPAPMPYHVRLMSKIELDPGCSIGPHTHEGEYELFYYLDGEITLNDNGEEKLMHAGDYSLCYDGELHGIANRSNATAHLFAVIVTKE